MQEIYVVLSHTSTYLARLIRFFTGYQYNHVSISLDVALEEMYSFGRKRPYNPFYAGFVHEDRQNGFYSVFTDTTSRIYRVTITDSQYRSLQKSIGLFQSKQEVYRFNLIGLFLNWFGVSFSRENHFFCAQFVSHVLEASKIYKFPKDPKLVNIRDFESFGNDCSAQIVYEGLLKDYIA